MKERMLLPIKEFLMIDGRKANSKVNTLRRRVKEIEKEVDFHTAITSSLMTWINANCTVEQKKDFSTYISTLTNELTKGA